MATSTIRRPAPRSAGGIPWRSSDEARDRRCGRDSRVNGLFKIGEQVKVTSPSATMAFLPSGAWQDADEDAYFRALGASPVAVREVLAELVRLSIAAVVREADGSIRVVRIGISDNESGLHYPSSPKASLKLGAKLPDGREIQILQELGRGAFFYESS